MENSPRTAETLITVNLKKGITAAQVVIAILPLLEYFAFDQKTLFQKGEIKDADGEITISEDKLVVHLNTEIGYHYVSFVLYPVAKNISKIAAEPGEIRLIYSSDKPEEFIKW